MLLTFQPQLIKTMFLSFADHRTSVSKQTPFSISKIANLVIMIKCGGGGCCVLELTPTQVNTLSDVLKILTRT